MLTSTYWQKKLFEWLSYRNSFLDELLRHEGFGDSAGSPLCGSCGRAEGTIKCNDCFSQLLYCQQCIVKEHVNLPLHRIKVCYIIAAITIQLTNVPEMEWRIL